MLSISHIKKIDKETALWIEKETKRQLECLEMIPSENYVSPAVLEATGSVLTNKYSEGYPGKRYYGGNQYIDEIEKIAIARAKKLFAVEYVNVQPYSGSPANLAVYMATCAPGDTIMGLDLTHGGHLTHGWKVSATGIFYKSVPYHIRKNDGVIDFIELEKLVLQHKPKLIWVGATAYVYEFPFKELAKIAEKTNSYLAADIAHIAGLVLAGVHISPVPYVDIITTTTHKTLRGPRGAIIMVTKKGCEKDSALPEKIDKAVFPGLQGGPHDHIISAIAVCLKEAQSPKFIKYGRQVVQNAVTLAEKLKANNLKLIGNGTENHMILVDLSPFFGGGGGYLVQCALEKAGITVNKNTIPGESFPPFYPSGIRLGTPALTTRGMKEKEMVKIAGWIAEIIQAIRGYRLPEDPTKRKIYLEYFKKEITNNKIIKRLKPEIRKFALNFPLFAW